jgi:hypothetical protein
MGVRYSEIIERMRWAGKLKNDSAVARLLGVTPQALSNYKKRGEMPTDLVLKFADIHGLSVDWLITGQGEMLRQKRPLPERQGLMAAEEGAPYHAGPSEAERNIPDLSSLNPDEIIYIGKVLKILRGANKTASTAIKLSVDTLLKAMDAPEEAPRQEPKK